MVGSIDNSGYHCFLFRLEAAEAEVTGLLGFGEELQMFMRLWWKRSIYLVSLCIEDLGLLKV